MESESSGDASELICNAGYHSRSFAGFVGIVVPKATEEGANTVLGTLGGVRIMPETLFTRSR